MKALDTTEIRSKSEPKLPPRKISDCSIPRREHRVSGIPFGRRDGRRRSWLHLVLSNVKGVQAFYYPLLQLGNL